MNGLSGGVKNTRGLNGDTGSQVAKSVAANSGVNIIHTVTAGKAFYLTNARLSHDGAGSGSVNVYIRDTGDVLTVELLWLVSISTKPDRDGIPFAKPLKIPSGYDVVLATSGCTAHVCITGWEEDA